MLTGCGSSSNTSSSSTTTASATSGTTASKTPSGEPIKIGSINALGTKANNDPARVAAVKAAAAALNKVGGLNGRPVEVDFCNNGFDPNKALACARQLIKDKVIACVGCENDVNGGDVMDVFKKANIPSVETEAIYPQEFSNSNSYLMSGGANYQIWGTVMLAHDLLKKKRWAYTCFDICSPDYLKYMQVIGKKLGMQFVGKVIYPLDTSNWDSYAAQTIKLNADVVIHISSPFANIPLIKAMESQGYKGDYVLNADVPHFGDFKQYGAAQSRVFVAGDVPPPSAIADYTDLKRYADQLAAYAKTADSKEGTTLPEARMSSIRSWLAAQMVFTVLKGKSDMTAKGLMDALNSAKDLQSDLIPAWTPSAAGCLKGYERVSNPNVFYMKIENSELTIADKTPHNVNDLLCG